MPTLPSRKQLFVEALKVHQAVYEGTRGLVGHRILLGMPALMLRTTGRRTGRTRTNALVYGKDGDRLLVCASNGGHRKPPAWLLNLEADPEVEVQVKEDRFKAKARVATPEEKAAMWPTMTKEWPAYDDYQKKTDRPIPIVVLERA